MKIIEIKFSNLALTFSIKIAKFGLNKKSHKGISHAYQRIC